MRSYIVLNIHYHLQNQSKVWTHLLIQEFFFIFTIFYIVENSEEIKTMKLHMLFVVTKKVLNKSKYILYL